MPVQFTTTLPDEDQPVLGNGVEDEVSVDREGSVSNYGDVRVQIRETGASSWDSNATGFAETLLAHDSLTTTFGSREDGEEYEVRARTETEHVTGAWTDPVSITTKFPGATNLSVDAVGATSVDLSWSDNSDNEDGFRVVRERYVDGSYWPEDVVADLAPNTTAHTEDTAQPGQQYRYRIRAYTEHTSADSGAVETTTSSIGVPSTRAPSQGPYVEIDTPAGETLTPTVAELEYPPEVNARPSVQVTVPKADRWDELKGQPMRVWDDGVQLPIDTLEGTSDTPSQTVLEATGGKELDQYTDDIQFDEKENHLAVEDLIANYTSYVSNVDDPATDTRSDVLMLEASGASIEDELLNPLSASDPLIISTLNGAEMTKTGWFKEVEDTDFTGTQRFADNDGNDGAWSGNQCVELSASGDGFSFKFAPDHEIPAGELELNILEATPDGNPGFTISIDGTKVEDVAADALATDADRFDLSWGTGYVLNSGSAIAAETHTVSLDVYEAGSGSMYADAAHATDTRFTYTWDDTPVDEIVDGPEEYPPTQTIVLDDVSSVEQVVAGNFTVLMSSTAGSQAVAISNDEGSNWIEATNAENVSGEFASASQQIRARVTLSRYSADPTTSPAQGDAGQYVDDLELRADLEDTPVLLDKQYRDRLANVITDITNDANSAWELRRDPAADPRDPTGMILEYTQVGQRTRSSTAPVTNFEQRSTIENSYERVVVFGRSKGEQGSSFTAPSSGNKQSIGDNWVVPDSERIYDPDTGTEFVRGEDYRMDWDIGAIELLDNSDMTSGETYEADYQHKYRGEAKQPDVTKEEARTIERAIPGATSDRECEQLALGILKQIQTEQLEATLTVARDDPSIPLVEALAHPRLPDGTHLIQGVESVQEGRQYRLANRRTAEEIIREIREDYNALADVV